MASIVYNLLLLILSPLGLVYYLWRVFVSRKAHDCWRENLGALPRFADRPKDRKLIWLHAVSVGEVVASLPIQDELRRLMPDAIILLTTVTSTGNAIARQSAKAVDAISYLPLDLLPCVSRAMNRVRPDVLILMEAEIWPNLLSAMKNRGVPVVLANGRISDKTMRRTGLWLRPISWAYGHITHFCMQTEDDAQRLKAIGVSPEAIHVLGSTKFDQDGAQLPADEVCALRARLGIPEGAQVFVAGSTNPGEDEPVLAAYKEMRGSCTDLRLIIAPRQIERADEIEAIAQNYGAKCVRRSRKETLSSGTDVLILDVLGELAKVYAVGDITFVGGTLIPKGGHSLVQPILQGKPVFFGPHTFKTKDVAAMAISAGVGFRVIDAQDLAAQGKALLLDAVRRAEIDSACRQLVSANQGASARCAKLVAGLLSTEVEV